MPPNPSTNPSGPKIFAVNAQSPLSQPIQRQSTINGTARPDNSQFDNMALLRDEPSTSPRTELLSLSTETTGFDDPLGRDAAQDAAQSPQSQSPQDDSKPQQHKSHKRSSRRHNKELSRSERAKALSNVPPRELLHMLIDQEHDAERMRRIIRLAYQNLEAESKRAEDAERANRDAIQRFKLLNESRLNAQQEVRKTTQELRVYKSQLDEAREEIGRTREKLRLVEKKREEAEFLAMRAKDKTRKISQLRIMDKAREEGRRDGFLAGLKHGHHGGAHLHELRIEKTSDGLPVVDYRLVSPEEMAALMNPRFEDNYNGMTKPRFDESGDGGLAYGHGLDEQAPSRSSQDHRPQQDATEPQHAEPDYGPGPEPAIMSMPIPEPSYFPIPPITSTSTQLAPPTPPPSAPPTFPEPHIFPPLDPVHPQPDFPPPALFPPEHKDENPNMVTGLFPNGNIVAPPSPGIESYPIDIPTAEQIERQFSTKSQKKPQKLKERIRRISESTRPHQSPPSSSHGHGQAPPPIQISAPKPMSAMRSPGSPATSPFVPPHQRHPSQDQYQQQNSSYPSHQQSPVGGMSEKARGKQRMDPSWYRMGSYSNTAPEGLRENGDRGHDVRNSNRAYRDPSMMGSGHQMDGGGGSAGIGGGTGVGNADVVHASPTEMHPQGIQFPLQPHPQPPLAPHQDPNAKPKSHSRSRSLSISLPFTNRSLFHSQSQSQANNSPHPDPNVSASTTSTAKPWYQRVPLPLPSRTRKLTISLPKRQRHVSVDSSAVAGRKAGIGMGHGVGPGVGVGGDRDGAQSQKSTHSRAQSLVPSQAPPKSTVSTRLSEFEVVSAPRSSAADDVRNSVGQAYMHRYVNGGNQGGMGSSSFWKNVLKEKNRDVRIAMIEEEMKRQIESSLGEELKGDGSSSGGKGRRRSGSMFSFGRDKDKEKEKEKEGSVSAHGSGSGNVGGWSPPVPPKGELYSSSVRTQSGTNLPQIPDASLSRERPPRPTRPAISVVPEPSVPSRTYHTPSTPVAPLSISRSSAVKTPRESKRVSRSTTPAAKDSPPPMITIESPSQGSSGLQSWGAKSEYQSLPPTPTQAPTPVSPTKTRSKRQSTQVITSPTSIAGPSVPVYYPGVVTSDSGSTTKHRKSKTSPAPSPAPRPVIPPGVHHVRVSSSDGAAYPRSGGATVHPPPIQRHHSDRPPSTPTSSRHQPQQPQPQPHYQYYQQSPVQSQAQSPKHQQPKSYAVMPEGVGNGPSSIYASAPSTSSTRPLSPKPKPKSKHSHSHSYSHSPTSAYPVHPSVASTMNSNTFPRSAAPSAMAAPGAAAAPGPILAPGSSPKLERMPSASSLRSQGSYGRYDPTTYRDPAFYGNSEMSPENGHKGKNNDEPSTPTTADRPYAPKKSKRTSKSSYHTTQGA